MGKNANRRKQVKQVKKQANQARAFHSGIDLFFRNITEDQAETLCRVLNTLDRTMGGHSLTWVLDYKDSRATITAHYPKQPFSAEYSLIGLEANRRWAETGLNSLGMTNVIFTGSEFYVEDFSDSAIQQFIADMNKKFGKIVA